MTDPQPTAPRFYFRYTMPADGGKLSALFLIATSLLWMALFDDFPVRAVSAVWLIAGVWVFLKGPVQPGFFIELRAKEVIINAL